MYLKFSLKFNISTYLFYTSQNIYILILFDRLQNKINVNVLMAELTPTALGVICNKSHGLRHMSSIINKILFKWFATTEFGEKCNIVAVDFVQSTDLVDAAIHWNRKKSIYP